MPSTWLVCRILRLYGVMHAGCDQPVSLQLLQFHVPGPARALHRHLFLRPHREATLLHEGFPAKHCRHQVPPPPLLLVPQDFKIRKRIFLSFLQLGAVLQACSSLLPSVCASIAEFLMHLCLFCLRERRFSPAMQELPCTFAVPCTKACCPMA